jgi:hypothetical protein
MKTLKSFFQIKDFMCFYLLVDVGRCLFVKMFVWVLLVFVFCGWADRANSSPYYLGESFRFVNLLTFCSILFVLM